MHRVDIVYLLEVEIIDVLIEVIAVEIGFIIPLTYSLGSIPTMII